MLNHRTAKARAFRLEQWECSETEIHVSLVDALRKFSAPDCLWLHIGNGERRDAITGAKLKRMGLRRGAADLLFVRANAPPLFLELKRHGARQSQSQVEFQALAEHAGAQYIVAHSLDEALAILWSRGFLARRLTL